MTDLSLDELATVTGGRITHGPVQISPEVVQAIGELSKSVQAAGQTIASAQSQNAQGMMQMMQQMAQAKHGR